MIQDIFDKLTSEWMIACPHCGSEHNRVTCLEGTYLPSPGDIGVCIDCGEPYIFQEVGESPRKATPDDAEGWSDEVIQQLARTKILLIEARRAANAKKAATP